MLGSVSDAEDLLQDVWLRWQRSDRAAVREPEAYLATTTTRLAINALTSARARHEGYVGTWLPEPVDTSADPQLGAERAAAVDLAMLLLMEQLTPTERAAYVLREAFDYPYAVIAEIVEASAATCRQLVSRARKRLHSKRSEPVQETAEHRRLLESFLAAARGGDLSALESLFHQDVVSYSDSGGHRLRGVSTIPVTGAAKTARFFRAFAPRFWPEIAVEIVEANGDPAALLRRDGRPLALLAMGVGPGGIELLLWQFDPAKLRQFAD